MAGLMEYKCPCCGGALEFNSEVQKVKCPFCDSEFEMEALQSYDEALNNQPAEQLNWDSNAGSEWSDMSENGLKSYVCKSCGGEIIADSNTAATSCPFCDNPIVLSEQFSGMLKPDYVIPFKLDKARAKEEYKKHLQGKKLLPRVFKDENHIDEIKGVYVPFWLYSATAKANVSMKGTKTSTWSDSKYRYTKTDYYSVVRGGNISFEHVPADGSSKMDDTLMEAIEPFDFSQAVPFQTAYLAGYVADKYDVDANQNVERANKRLKNSTQQAFERTATGYSTLTSENVSIQLSHSKAAYAFYPVWLLNTTWNNQKFVFAMNGQTGKFVGDLPMDKSLAKAYFFKTTGLVSAIAFALFTLIWFI